MSFVQPSWNSEGKPLVWDSGWFAVAANTTYTQTHDLNQQPLNVAIWFSTSATGGAEHRVSYLVSIPNYGAQTTEYRGAQVFNVTTTQLSVITHDKVGIDTTSANWQTSGYYRVLVWA